MEANDSVEDSICLCYKTGEKRGKNSSPSCAQQMGDFMTVLPK